jgi:glycerophosphoryl diester phosphodiesterase
VKSGKSILLSLSLLFLASCTPKIDHLTCPFAQQPKEWTAIQHDPLRFIAHAAGEIEGHRYTDSGSALEKSLSRGYRLIEFDLETLDDNTAVAAHDWDHWRAITGFKGEKISLQDFKSQKIHQKLNSITLKEISDVFKNKPDVYLITDKIKDYDQLTKSFYSTDRLLVEIFSVDDFYEAVKKGIKYPMMSLTTDAQVKFAVDKKVKMATIHTVDIPKYSNELRQIVGGGGCVFAYSSNEAEFIKKSIADGLITGVYADSWNLQKGSCDSANKCDTY